MAPTSEPFQDKVIAITGTASGMGLVIAKYLAERGASLSLADASQPSLDLIEPQFEELLRKDRLLLNALDVRNGFAVNAWITETVEKFGRLSGAVNFAGVGPTEDQFVPLTEIRDDTWDRIIDVNLKGVMYCMREELRNIDDGGSIVNAASVAGIRGQPNASPYVASKHGVVGLTKAAAMDFASRGIRINAVAPGIVKTPLVEKYMSELGEVANPMSRVGLPGDIAPLVVFLLSDESGFITGQVYAADGGQSC